MEKENCSNIYCKCNPCRCINCECTELLSNKSNETYI